MRSLIIYTALTLSFVNLCDASEGNEQHAPFPETEMTTMASHSGTTHHHPSQLVQHVSFQLDEEDEHAHTSSSSDYEIPRLHTKATTLQPRVPNGNPTRTHKRLEHTSAFPSNTSSEADDEQGEIPRHSKVDIHDDDLDTTQSNDGSIGRPVSFAPFPQFRRASSATDTKEDGSEYLNRSMAPWEQVDGNTLYDREEYLRKIVEEMQSDAELFKDKAKMCRWCNINWTVFGAITGVAAMTVSGLGAANFIEPRLANIIATSLYAMSGFMIWMGEQSHKASKNYHKAYVMLLRRLGVPTHMLPPDPHIAFESFEPSNNNGRASNATPRTEAGALTTRTRSTLFVPPRHVKQDSAVE